MMMDEKHKLWLKTFMPQLKKMIAAAYESLWDEYQEYLLECNSGGCKGFGFEEWCGLWLEKNGAEETP